MPRIVIRWNGHALDAELLDTPTSEALLAVLPFEAKANTWGEEVYFDAPIAVKLETDAREVVDPGTVCFWVEGASLALPFGPTPVSRGDECRLVTRVNVLGKIIGDPKSLQSIRSGALVRVERAKV